MRARRVHRGWRRLLVGLVLLWRVGPSTPTPARAAPAEEGIDDPKLARRLGTRYAAPLPGPAVAPVAAVPPGPAVVTSPPPTAPGAVVSPLPAAPVAAPGPIWPGGGPTAASPPPTGVEPAATIVATPMPPPESNGEPVLPRVQLAFRRFSFVQLGASSSPSGLAESEPFDNFSLDVYPLSSVVRLGFSTAYGWQEGKSSGGDYLATESFSAGFQIGGRQVVPFAEGFAGIGYMRRLQFDRTVPTVFWQLGVDAGALIYFGRVGFVSVALGYLRPVNGFAEEQSFASVYVNTWSFKLGVGL